MFPWFNFISIKSSSKELIKNIFLKDKFSYLKLFYKFLIRSYTDSHTDNIKLAKLILYLLFDNLWVLVFLDL